VRPAVVRSLVASAILALTAAALTSAPTATAAPTTGAGDRPAAIAARVGEPPLRIGTYNIRAGVSLGDFKTAVTAFKQTVAPDVAGLQEIGSNERNKFLVADTDWGYYRPPQLQQNPVIWRRDLFDFVGARGFMIAKARDLNGEHSGDEAKGDSYATVVRLVQRASGEQISFINVHLVRGAVKGGRPAPGKPNLFKLFTDQVSGTVAAIKAERAISDRVYVLGDFNVGYKADAKWRHRLLPYKNSGGSVSPRCGRAARC
jgi:endonuclease/exonuclease/phosphatase family metal-dependent hydrolase